MRILIRNYNKSELLEMEISINQEISFKLKIYFLIKYEELNEKLYIM